jgi:hypothetical protein
MHRGLAADHIDGLDPDFLEHAEHGHVIAKAHVRDRRQRAIKTEVAGPVASKRGVKLNIVRTCFHNSNFGGIQIGIRHYRVHENQSGNIRTIRGYTT